MKLTNLDNVFRCYFEGDRQTAEKIKRSFVCTANHYKTLAKKARGEKRRELLRQVCTLTNYAAKIKLGKRPKKII